LLHLRINKSRKTGKLPNRPNKSGPTKIRKGSSLDTDEMHMQKAWLDKPRQYLLVGGFDHLEKYEIQLEGLSHILWNIRFMFQTTNQLWMFMIDLH
jgi:hypothetical protein